MTRFNKYLLRDGKQRYCVHVPIPHNKCHHYALQTRTNKKFVKVNFLEVMPLNVNILNFPIKKDRLVESKNKTQMYTGYKRYTSSTKMTD